MGAKFIPKTFSDLNGALALGQHGALLDGDHSGSLSGNARVNVLNNGASVGTRRAINLLPGSNITYSIADNAAAERVDVTINSAAGTVGGVGVGGQVTFFSNASTLSSDGAFVWDNTNKRLGVGTSPATAFHVQGVLRTGETPARSFELGTRDAVTTFPVPSIRPSTANTVVALDIMPNGNPAEYGTNGKAWIDVCDTDIITGSPLVTSARVGIRAAVGAEFGSHAWNGATAVPITFTIDAVQKAQITTGGVFGVGLTAPVVSGAGACIHMSGDTFRVGTARTITLSTATGNAGEVCWDASYIYVCTAANTWKRAAILTW